LLNGLEAGISLGMLNHGVMPLDESATGGLIRTIVVSKWTQNIDQVQEWQGRNLTDRIR